MYLSRFLADGVISMECLNIRECHQIAAKIISTLLIDVEAAGILGFKL